MPGNHKQRPECLVRLSPPYLAPAIRVKTVVKPIVEMAMKADVAHDFWLGKVNVPFAIVSGKIMARGPVAKALQLLPVIKPAFDIYPNVISQHKKVMA